MKDRYKNYFKEHYKSAFSARDILTYQKWFCVQYRFIKSKIKPARDILEIGSGLGGFYSLLPKESQKKYVGLELDADSVCFANAYFKSEVFLNTSLEEFEPKSQFGVVCAFEVLEHLDNPIFGIQKIATLLEKKGVFIGTSPYPYKKNVVADKTHTFVLHPENWKQLFLNNGFTSVEIFPMSFLPSLWRMHRNLNIRLPFYVPFTHCVSTCLLVAKK
jgi:SAM-dependent methyltransferase